MGITIIGLGYVGLVNAVVLASYGYEIIGYDVDKEKVALLKQGISPIEEDGVQILLVEAKQHLRFTSNAKDAIRPNQIFIIAVDTPIGKDGNVNLKNYYDALDDICENAISDSSVIIYSTVPVGTNKKTKVYLEEHSSFKFDVISKPEFITQGRALKETVLPSRIIIGTNTKKGETLVRGIYEKVLSKKVPIMVTTPENAELIKIGSNGYLAMRIAYINEMARLCEQYGGDIDKVYLGMSIDPRIGLNYFKAGLGYGGSGFPNEMHREAGKESPSLIAQAISESNNKQVEFFLNKIFTRFKSITNMKVAVLGLAFKGGTEDVRNTLASPVIKALLDKYAEVYAYDQLAQDNFHKLFPRHTHIHYVDYLNDALKKADFAVILTDSPEFRKLTSSDFKHMKHPIVFDGRNLFKLEAMDGVEYHSIGRPTVNKK